MATVTPVEEKPPSAGKGDDRGEGRSVRFMLAALFVLLLAAAIALLVLLVWLLRPEAAPRVGGGTGYPVRVERSIYGFGSASTQLLKTPLAATFDGAGNVWISDTGNSRVLVFTQDGALIRIIGADAGPGKLATPYGIAVDDPTQRAYVADWTAGKVQIYSTASGAYLGSIPDAKQTPNVFGPNSFTPYDVHVLDGNVVVSSNDGLYFFGPGGRVVARWGGSEQGLKVGMFNFPDAFAVDPSSGRVYVADTLNRRVVALDSNGHWLWVSGMPDAKGKIRGFWQLPRGIRVGPDGNVYVVDTFRFDQTGVGNGQVVVLSPDGRLVSEFGRAGTQEDSFDFPEKFDVTKDGLFALADRENNRVVLFRLTGLPKPDASEEQMYAKSFHRVHGAKSAPPT